MSELHGDGVGSHGHHTNNILYSIHKYKVLLVSNRIAIIVCMHGMTAHHFISTVHNYTRSIHFVKHAFCPG